jgi:hypothetical protein
LNTNGYQGFITVELAWDYTLDPVTAARLARQRVKDYLNI